jgi:ABC-type lipoprotein release transport system permease subunit
MAQNSQTRRAPRDRISLTAIISLALWRARQTSFLMAITAIGMIASIVIVCAVPLFGDIMNTAALRGTLASNSANAEIEINTTTMGLSSKVQSEVGGEFAALLQQNMGTMGHLLHPSQFSIISTNFDFASSPPKQRRSLVLYGVDMTQAAGHLGKLQGQLPSQATTLNQLNVLISANTAKVLGLKIGDTVPILLSFYPKAFNAGDPNAPSKTTQSLTAHISGIFDGDPKQADYWHGSNFDPLQERDTGNATELISATMLVPNQSLLFLSDQLAAQNKSDAIFAGGLDFTLRWYYRLDFSHLSINDLDEMMADVNNVQTTYQASYGDTDSGLLTGPLAFPYLTRTALLSPLFSSGQTTGILDLLNQRVAVSRISATVLSIQIILLVLFFVGLMTNLLIDRQEGAIALMRSRGASRKQIFAVLLTQCLMLGLVAFVIGIPLAIGIVIAMARHSLSGASQQALNIVTDRLAQAVEISALYGLGILLVVLLTMSIQLFSASRMDVLALRRQSARASRRPLWQRLNLDIIAGILALLSYGISLYLTSLNGVLQGDARTLIVAPLSVMAPFFLIIGCLLLLLRVFPLLLRLASRLAARSRDAVPMLAFAQISRSPRQPLRMTMLLALATAFTLFTLIYTASEAYHIQQVTTYMLGADFSGNLDSLAPPADPARAEQPFQKINGVLSATAGYTISAVGGKGAIPIAFRAVDANTFAHSVIWPSQAEENTGNRLLARLVSFRQKITAGSDVPAVPAIVDTVTASKLLLQVNSFLPISISGLNIPTVQYYIIGIVPSLPTVNNHLITGVEGTQAPGGVLVDYTTFRTIYTRLEKQKIKSGSTSFPDTPQLNTIWLHTAGDAASLANVRTALTKAGTRLSHVSDRWQLLADLTNDPLYLVLGGVLSIGTITALLLALVGDLLASWLSARARLVNFAIVRALGSTLGEVASMLAWEQVIIYVTGLLLGAAFGWLLATNIIPALTFTDLNTNVNSDQFYSLQSALPIQVVIPPTLPFGLLVLGVLFILALVLSTRVVSRPILSQVLRLNED